MSVFAQTRRTAIEEAFGRWSEAIGAGDADRIAALYAPDAVLVPTFSSEVRRNTAGIADYFRGFVQGGPRCRLLEGAIRAMGDAAVYSGTYRFTMTEHEDQPEIDARFTFVYGQSGGVWLIVAHHSSVAGTP